MALTRLLVLGMLPLVAQTEQLLVSHFSGTVYTLELTSSGNLSITSSNSDGPIMPSWLTYDAASSMAYCADESFFGTGNLNGYKVGNASLEITGTTTTAGGDLYSNLYGGTNGTGFIVLANYNGGYISNYPLPIEAGTSALQKIQFTMNGPGPVPSRQDAPHPHSAFTDPTGAYVLTPDLGADLIRIFSIDDSTGELTTCTPVSTGAGDGPRHGGFVTTDDSTYLYVANELGNSMSSWQLAYPSGDETCLNLTHIATVQTYPSNTTTPADSKAAEVHTKGGFVYVSNRGDETFGANMDSIAVFATDAATGAPSFLQLANAHAYFPRTFAINAAGDKLAVGGQTSANVPVLARDTATGLLGDLIATVDVGAKGTYEGEDGLSSVVWAESGA